MKKLPYLVILFGALALVGCKQEKKEETTPSVEVQEIKEDATEKAIGEYITSSLLSAEELPLLTEADRQFQFYAIDLNNDGAKEFFVRLSGPYFCGTGGCTVLLLNAEYQLITKFTVMQGAIFAEPTLENTWRVLTVKSEGEWKSLVYANGTYPTNPSVLEKAPYDAPSGHAVVIFDEDENLESHKF
ncbi:hypothetical protein [Myroides pelagicus]|uniref:Lipoprotein n=1 Tax=Myroides pelagicus TaxID=270914 RepID=A0A7K1GMD5_9FLAO|nr:hypothetical protein [Myroides pelagicus]MTH30062.1 hypothetical protein [Myroides pelagicus]